MREGISAIFHALMTIRRSKPNKCFMPKAGDSQLI